MKNMIKTIKNAAIRLREDKRGGDAGTNFIIGILIAVVVVGLLIGLLQLALPEWWEALSGRVMEILGM